MSSYLELSLVIQLGIFEFQLSKLSHFGIRNHHTQQKCGEYVDVRLDEHGNVLQLNLDRFRRNPKVSRKIYINFLCSFKIIILQSHLLLLLANRNSKCVASKHEHDELYLILAFLNCRRNLMVSEVYHLE